MIYLLILILLIYLSYKYDYCPSRYFIYKKKKRITFILLSIFLTLFVGLRYRVGLDTIGYEESFHSILTLDQVSFEILKNSEWDPLFYLFVSFSKSIFNEFWFFQLLQSILVNTIVFSFFWRNCSNSFTASTIYFIFLYMSFACETMRESCAVAMLLLGWNYLKKDKWVKFSFFLILALGFHISAIALFILPILKIIGIWKLMKINKKMILFLLFLMIMGTAISIHFFDYLTLLNVSSRFDARAASYAEENLVSEGLNYFGILSKLVQFALYPMIAVLSLKRYAPNKLYPNIEQMIVLGLIFVFLSLNIGILYRYQNYFMPFAFITIANMFYSNIAIGKRLNLKITSFRGWLIFFMPAIFFWWLGLNQPVRGDARYRHYMIYQPYSSIIIPHKDIDREIIYKKYGY